MYLRPPPASSLSLIAAFAISLIVHLLVLLIELQPPESASPPRLQARLAPATAAPRADVRPPPPPPKAAATPASRVAKLRPAPRILTARKSTTPLQAAEATPKWSVAQKQEMDRFLDELATEAKAKPRPDLAERSMAMAREMARGDSRPHRDELAELVERIPNSPPVDPFSLEFYLDSLVKKLNRSAAFVKNDPRARGIQPASIEVRLNPDGTLKSFTVVRSGDQHEEIDFVRSVVGRAAPFAAFPPDIVKSARSLALMICIQPAGSGGGGFGFTRKSGGGC